MYILLVLYIGIIGLALGSFINALVYRVYTSEFAPKKTRRKLSILNGRSQCVHCHHTLAISDLVPLFSWLALGGKCRYCKEPISAQYPVIEALTALGLILSFHFWPFAMGGIESVRFAVWAVILTLCIALIITDVRWMLLPNKIVYPLIVFAVIFSLLSPEPLTILTIAQTVLSAMLLGGLFHILYIVSNGKWIGGGDVPLGYALGIIVGDPVKSLLLLFLSSVLALAAFVALSTVSVKKQNIIAYGPFLIVAMIIIMLSGPYVQNFIEIFSL